MMDDDDDWDDAVWSTIDALETSHLQNRQDTSGANAQWACRSCTLLNSAARTTCSICNTPRGQVYASAAPSAVGTTSASFFTGPAAPSSVLSQPKKTVQATLPFAKTGVMPTTTMATRTNTTTESATHRPSTILHTKVNSTVNSTKWLSRTPPTSRSSNAMAVGSSLVGDEADELENNASGMAIAARLRHKGEDLSAKVRYLSEIDAPLLRHHPQIDREAARIFVYPTNYSVREYQLTIAERALYHNTLVSLPTGLGKTLIASVVMYNFYRWFPEGQIVFMAPTKPLVAQQIGACHEIMGIPLHDTAELQGNVPPSTRKILWSTKRVFFCTPQSMQNDLQRGICHAERLVCLVVDEAHRATGNYAYCGVIQEVEKATKHFRVLALSATPGAKFDVIQDVVRNLRITHIESRSADDTDVKKYTHARQEEVIKCSLNSKIAETKKIFLQVFERITQRLLVNNIIQHKDPERLTRWYVLQMRERFRTSPNYQSQRSSESDLALLITLLHARDLLTAHGLSSFKGWLDDFMTEEQEKGKRLSWSKKELLQSTEFQALVLSLQHITGEESSSPSHPKLLKLREVLHEHFQRHAAGQSSTRAIVFTQYRTSVQEIVKLLEPLSPLVKAQQFIGQGASGKAKESKGQTQKEQQEIVRKFRAGLFNVLVATCIAEEGLDIGEVDLIVSFDALTSPVRMIQRMGRTGRKRVGKVVILVTEGDEEKKLARSVASAKTVSRALTTFKSKFVYGKCARMIPHDVSPELAALEMDIPEFHASQIAGKQTVSRSTRVGGDGVAERREMWKLNELERSIVRGKYTPADWTETPRHEFLSITGSRKSLLRQRRPDEQDCITSDRSRVLRTIVRRINGILHDDEFRNSRVEPQPTVTLDAYSVIGQKNDEVLEFSDPDDAKDYDHQMHYSPPPSGGPEAPEPATPVRSEGARTPRGVGISHLRAFTTTESENGSAGGVRVSPLRQTTITGKPSPSPKRRSSVGSGRKVRKKVDKPRDAIDEALLERGERLIERLNEMLSNQSIGATKSPFEEPEPSIPPEDCAEFQFSFPRIARRLMFDDVNECKVSSTVPSTTQEDCVPPPPSLVDMFSSGPVTVIESASKTLHVKQSSPIDPVVYSQPCTHPQDDAFNPVTENASETLTRTTISDVCNGDCPGTRNSRPLAGVKNCFASIGVKSAHAVGATKPKRSLALRVPIPEDSGRPVATTEVPKPGETPSKESTPVTAHVPRHVMSKKSTEKLRDARLGVAENVRVSKAEQRDSQHRSNQVSCTQGQPCSVCSEYESFDDDPIVFCDGCDTAVHQFCYGIPVLPSDEWYCESCTHFSVQGKLTTKPKPRRCALCPMRSLSFAMRQTECQLWVHVQCFMWIPELRFHFEAKKLVLGQLGQLDADRKALSCSLCHSKRGYGIIQCAHKRCLNAFHVSCASAASDQNYRLVQLDQEEDAIDKTLFIAYCPLHNKSEAVWKPAEKQQHHHGLLELGITGVRIGTPTRSPARLVASPSALLASQVDSSKKQRKQFRRLKRKYDTAIPNDGSTERTSPAFNSPWAKRVRRSQQHAEGKRAQAKALARMFIDDEVEAPSTGSDDDDEDVEMDDEDRDFINDSSQLIYSQSVPTPERKKKSKRNSLGDMRAIYARSLIESPVTPAFLRRGRGFIPSGGIINACLQELHGEENESASTTPSSCSEKSQLVDHSGGREAHDIIEIGGNSQGDPHLDRGDQPKVVSTEVEPSLPCFDLLGAAGSIQHTGTIGLDSNKPKCESTDIETEESRQMQERIEANRLKALLLLEAKQAARRLKGEASSTAKVRDRDQFFQNNQDTVNNAHRVGADALEAESDISPMPTVRNQPATSSQHKPQSTMCAKSNDVKSSDQRSTDGVKHVLVYVQPTFRESHFFKVLEGCATADIDMSLGHVTFDAIDSLDVNVLLSLRVAAIVIDEEMKDLLQHPTVELARVVFKSFLVIVRVSDHSTAQTVSQSETIRRLRELPSCRSVVVTNDASVIGNTLLEVAREEARLGFGLAPLTMPTTKVSTGHGVDAHFHERFQFFRSTGLLSIGSVISLSFRFDKFTVKQIPVTKFSYMHWCRMLPWVPETVARQLQRHFARSSG